MSDLRDVDDWFIAEVLPHEARYLAVARRLAPRDAATANDAADLVHDAYARLFASDGWRCIDDPRAYVLRMVHNLAIERLRRARIVRMEALTDLVALRQASDAPDSFDIASGRERLRMALDALSALPPKCRQVMELRRLHDVPPREIARRLGLSLSTVEKRLARAMVLITRAMAHAPPPAARGPAEPRSDTRPASRLR